jgi:hypothetical protein
LVGLLAGQAEELSSYLSRDRAVSVPLLTYNLDFFDGKKPKPVTLGFSLAGFVYGLLHLSAWCAPFPSAVQRLLWKLSSLTLVSSGIVVLVLGAIIKLVSGLFDRFEHRIGRDSRWPVEAFTEFIVLFVVAAYSLLYIFVRICLVVECFLGLTHLPDAIFKVPQWSTYFPHIS